MASSRAAEGRGQAGGRATVELHRAVGTLQVGGLYTNDPHDIYFRVPISYRDQAPVLIEVAGPDLIEHRFLRLDASNAIVCAQIEEPLIQDEAQALLDASANLSILATRIASYVSDIPTAFPHDPRAFDAYYTLHWRGNSCTGHAHAATALALQQEALAELMAGDLDGYTVLMQLARLRYREIGLADVETIFLDDCEGGANGWTHGGIMDMWELGAPAVVGPDGCPSGACCWATNIDGDYFYDQDIWLLSPPIDLAGLSLAMLDLKLWLLNEDVPFRCPSSCRRRPACGWTSTIRQAGCGAAIWRAKGARPAATRSPGTAATNGDAPWPAASTCCAWRPAAGAKASSCCSCAEGRGTS